MLWVKTHLIFKTVILGIATMSRGGMGYQLGEEINLISILPCNEGYPDKQDQNKSVIQNVSHKRTSCARSWALVAGVHKL